MSINPSRVIPIQAVAPGARFQNEQQVYPRAVSGWFASWRWIFVALTQAFFYGMPWLQWGGRQALLFDVEAQRFYVLGLILYPQDLIYLAALLVLSALALFLFTAVAGRLWCGYSCPQTVYTEIFMWMERRFEGDRQARMKLDRAPWSANKLLRKGGKQAGWIAVALVTGFTFVGYFTPIRALAQQAAAFAVSPWNLFWIVFYAGATYGNAGFLREQMCKYICPYARFQSALIDKDSLIITYDAGRGEPRGARSRKAVALDVGSCVDCTLCVQVCPTGIDIRNGLQNECIGCAACIDVCNAVMDKTGQARGLIRYSTENGVQHGWTRLQMFRRALRPRVLIYAGVLGAAALAFTASLATRAPFQADVIKDRGTLARVVEDGWVENVYRVQVMNRTERAGRYRIEASGPAGLVVPPTAVDVPATGIQSVVVQLRLPFDAAQPLRGQMVPVVFSVLAEADPARSVREKSTFFVPR
jgi:cytochrome c oxidase accessory protein FixG